MTKEKKTPAFWLIMAVVVLGSVGMVIVGLGRPDLVATVELGKNYTITITNHNVESWQDATISLASAIDAPTYTVAGRWAPNESKTIGLDAFHTRVNRAPFRPEVQRVQEVIVDAPGFGLSIYRP